MENVHSNRLICNNYDCQVFYDCARSLETYRKKEIKIKYPTGDCFIPIEPEEDDRVGFEPLVEWAPTEEIRTTNNQFNRVTTTLMPNTYTVGYRLHGIYPANNIGGIEVTDG